MWQTPGTIFDVCLGHNCGDPWSEFSSRGLFPTVYVHRLFMRMTIESPFVSQGGWSELTGYADCSAPKNELH